MSKRDFSDMSAPWMQQQSLGDDRKRKRRSRWATDEEDKALMPSVIPSGLDKNQEEQYLVQLQIEEISRRLRTGDLGIPANPEDRSPSPEPIYNNEGKRLNTREYRTRKKLEEERHRLVTRAMELNTDYKPPADYKPPIIRVNDKVMIPQEEHPDINFVGLLIGPRGNTLKNLEKDTGAKIIIRGKGSVKEGKIGRKDGQPLPGEDEPLHAYVTANNPEHVKKAVEKIKEIIRQGIEVPEGQNDLRRQQLRELALLNGTLRENDALSKLKQIQQAQTIITNTIICSVCGGTGHIAQDCKAKRPGDTFRNMVNSPLQTPADKAKMDSEYMSLMAELGEGPPPSRPLHLPPHHHSQPPPMRSPFTSQPPPMLQLQPPPTTQWQQQQPPPAAAPPGVHQMRPPQMLGPPPQSLPSQPPPVTIQASLPPPMMGVPPPGVNSAPPWSQPPPQTMVTQTPPPQMTMAPTTLANNFRGPPPNVLPPPPPPPPSSQQQFPGQPPVSQPQFPWQQPPPQQAPQQQPPGPPMQNFGVPPPPPAGQNLPPWQQAHPQPSVAPVPPPPPSNIPPWQQPHMQGPPNMGPGPVAPPPPPPGSQGGPVFNPIAPPPPPPGGELQHLGMPGGIPLGVPPPPPPN